MTAFTFVHRALQPIGVEVDFDLSRPLDQAQQQALRDLLYDQGVLLFRSQSLSDEDQTRVMGHFGNVLVEEHNSREMALDGNFGNLRLLFHADLAFTNGQFKLLSLYGVDIGDNRATTLFSSGTKVLHALPRALHARVAGLRATTVIPPTQIERATSYDTPDFLPQLTQPAIIPHPVTGTPILSIFEMMTSRFEGLPPAESEALLQKLFGYLYAPENIYEHVWRTGDLVIWDNIALAHARPDQGISGKRRLRRLAVADKTFFELCPGFVDDPRVLAWGATGGNLYIA
jgi:taurine dioxygenase